MSRRLYRSRTESVIGGVCGGVAEYLDVDPSIVRIIWAVLGLVTGGIFVVLYVVMWIVVPEAPGTEGAAAPSAMGPPAPARRRGSGSGSLVLGLILVGLGAFFLVRQYLPQIDTDLLWPIGLILLGVVLVAASLRKQRAE
jgi:phage shock protein C